MIKKLFIGLIFFLTVLLSSSFTQSGKSWAERMADSEMVRFPQSWMLDFSSKPKWGYCQGLVCQAMLDVWKETGNRKYYLYAKSYADTMINPDGSIKSYQLDEYNIDQVNPGKFLFDLYKETNDNKYLTAINTLREQMRSHPRTSEGGFWHKKRYPWQMWLDGLYMGTPFLAQYAKEFNDTALFTDVVNQIVLIDRHNKDSKTGLYYHGWDEKHVQNWANPQTGQSPCFWGRSIGWYAMAMVDVLEFLPQNHPGRKDVIQILNGLFLALEKYKDKQTGLWYQVTDQGGRKGNYIEATCSAMYIYAYAKAANNGWVDKKYFSLAQKAFKNYIKYLIRVEPDKTVAIKNCCAVAGLSEDRPGTYEYYISEKVRDNDPKATGPFIMAALELKK
jgi:unsaturated rhamnogalacturonyl hydrolase